MDSKPHSHRIFVERLLIVVLMIMLLWLLWQMRSVVILLFGSILFAVILRIIANPIQSRFRLPDSLALFIAVLIVFGILALAIFLFGAEVVRQASVISDAIPAAWESIQQRLAAWGMREPLAEIEEQFRSNSGGVLSSLGSLAMSIGNALADTILLLVGGIFLAARPDLYRTGLIKLVPEEGRGRTAQALNDVWNGLRLWLAGRLAAMVLVGLLTGTGLWLLDVPAALTLGLVAGLLEFIPFIGPVLAAIPAILLALLIDPITALWVAGLYLFVQQMEGNVISPIVQHHAVDLPPALLLFSLVAAGLVFGVLGVLLAEPLTVVLFVLVKRLYVRDTLHTKTSMPGGNDNRD